MGVAGLIGLVLWLAVLLVFYNSKKLGGYFGRNGWDKLKGKKKDGRGGTGKRP